MFFPGESCPSCNEDRDTPYFWGGFKYDLATVIFVAFIVVIGIVINF